MKVGILSMQKILNYGSLLQAFSLKNEFEKRGHDVYFIDIERGRQIVDATVATSGGILSKFDKYFFKRIQNLLLSCKMTKIHVNDYTKYLEIDKKLPLGEKFDLVVIGSDEVFNATTPSWWGFSPQLFGKVKNANHVVTYAASCGATTYDAVKSSGIEDDVRECMHNLEKISVRDQNTYDFVKEITGNDALIHVDPVFLADYDAYVPNTVHTKRKYMLVYAYSNRINDENEIYAIKTYAKEKGLEILCVGMQQRWCKHNIPANAFELLGYVKGAECIVTDTFHGTVFSIKYNKKFVTFIRKSNKNKLGGLLNQFELMNRAIIDTRDFTSIMDSPIDFTSVNERIVVEKMQSCIYLDEVCKLGENK